MRVDSTCTTNHLHWHDGCTCHGYPTLEECATEAVARGWTGRALERTDKQAREFGIEDGTREVKCYSLISDYFDHYAKQGKFVAEVETKTTWRRL